MRTWVRAGQASAVVSVFLALGGCSNGGDIGNAAGAGGNVSSGGADNAGAGGNVSSGGAGNAGSGGVSGDSSTSGAGGEPSTSGAGGEPSTSGGAGEAGTGGRGDEGDAILTAESEAIEIRWFSYWAGGYRFERRIDQLSPAQLDLAESIKVVPATDACWADAVELAITVTQGDMARAFSANDYTGTCGRDVTLVEFEAVTALLDTVECLSAKGYDGSSAETAPSIVPDDGCWHGLFNSSVALPTWWFRTEIPAAGEYRISIDGCGDRELTLDLLEADGTTDVASITGQGQCPVLAHSFADAGSYLLRLEMLSGTYAGDFYLSLESTH